MKWIGMMIVKETLTVIKIERQSKIMRMIVIENQIVTLILIAMMIVIMTMNVIEK
jgi:hypothetical protein